MPNSLKLFLNIAANFNQPISPRKSDRSVSTGLVCAHQRLCCNWAPGASFTGTNAVMGFIRNITRVALNKKMVPISEDPCRSPCCNASSSFPYLCAGYALRVYFCTSFHKCRPASVQGYSFLFSERPR